MEFVTNDEAVEVVVNNRANRKLLLSVLGVLLLHAQTGGAAVFDLENAVEVVVEDTKPDLINGNYFHARLSVFLNGYITRYVNGELELAHLGDHMPSLATRDQTAFVGYMEKMRERLEAQSRKMEFKVYCGNRKRDASVQSLSSRRIALDRRLNNLAFERIDKVADKFGYQVFNELGDYIEVVTNNMTVSRESIESSLERTGLSPTEFEEQRCIRKRRNRS